MRQLHLTDETLMAYIDGELDPAMIAAVEDGMSRDPIVLRRTAAFLRSRQLARRAFVSAPMEVPEQLRRIVSEEALPPSRPKRSAPSTASRRLRRAFLPLAAAVLVIAAGVVGYFLPERGGTGLFPRVSSGSVIAALNALPSGRETDVTGGRLRAISTVKIGDALCREVSVDQSGVRSRLVACRSGAEWTTAFAIVESPSDGYRPAGQGDDLLAQFLDDSGASAPLFGVEEERALTAH